MWCRIELNTFSFLKQNQLTAFKKLFKQTFIYGLATVLPRMLTFLLVPLYTTVLAVEGYGEFSLIFSWIIFFNVILAYGMETAFFRFFHKEPDQRKVVSTATISLTLSSLLFLVLGFLFYDGLAMVMGIHKDYLLYTLLILVFDALVVIPFAWLRAQEKPKKYAVLKILNVAVNLGLNVFLLLLLPKLATNNPDSFWQSLYIPNFEISYAFISFLIASGLTLLLLLPFYTKATYSFDKQLWRRMMRYAFPVMIAGIAYAINETFDRILLEWLLPENIAEREIGLYAACYKLAVFMTLFATAFRLGIEPFFFSKATADNARETYAQITRYFVALGSVILITVVVFADLLKYIIIPKSTYWEAMDIVPLILIANFCLGIYHNLSVLYKITDRTKFGAYISIAGAVLTLVINIILIPRISYMGSAIATVTAYGSMMLLSYYFGQKYYKIPYNLKRILSYFFGAILFSVLAFYTFRDNYFVRIPLWIAFVMWIAYSEKQLLKQLFTRKL